jgi:hypothetical protein
MVCVTPHCFSPNCPRSPFSYHTFPNLSFLAFQFSHFLTQIWGLLHFNGELKGPFNWKLCAVGWQPRALWNRIADWTVTRRPYNATEVFVTGTFDDWGKTVKLDRVGDIFVKKVTISPVQKVHYKVRFH